MSSTSRRSHSTDRYRGPLSERILFSIEAQTDFDPMIDRLELYESIDPESLDTLFANPGDVDIIVESRSDFLAVTLDADGVQVDIFERSLRN
ncbi:HalOD1 output domain-containing protein (plasmid) [Haloferacaceae archaeon DSL9]